MNAQDANDACGAIVKAVDEIAWETDLLCIMRAGGVTADVRELVQHRARTRPLDDKAEARRMATIEAAMAVLRCSLHELTANEDEREILRLARATGCVVEMRDFADVQARKMRRERSDAQPPDEPLYVIETLPYVAVGARKG